MITADHSRSATDLRVFSTDLRVELESLVALLENIDFGSRILSWKPRPDHSAIRPGYNAKTYNQKNVTVEEDRILGLPIFSYEISISKKFEPKKHFKQFQQFSAGLWRDYALLLLTDNTIGLLDLTSRNLVSTVTVPFSVTELHVENVSDELQAIASLIERGRDILEKFIDGDTEDPDDLAKIVEFLGSAHVGLLFRTGKVGFFSGALAQTNSYLSPEIILGRLDLSKASEGLFEDIPTDDPIFLNPEITLRQAVTMDLTTSSEFTILEKVRRKF